MKLKTILLTLTFCFGAFVSAQNITKSNFNAEYSPKYMSSGSSTSMATNFKANIFGLSPGETYYYYVTAVLASDLGTTFAGAGGSLFYNQDSTTKYASSPDFVTAGNYDSFTVTGPFVSSWFGFVNDANSRYTAGNYVYPMITIKSASSGSMFSARFALNDSIKVLAFNTSSGNNNGTGIYGLSKGIFQEMVLLYDSAAGDIKPLTIAMIENDKFTASGHNAPSFYSTNVDGKTGAWGAIIPNTLAKGVRRIDRRKFDDGSLLHSQRDTNGVWLSVDTRNPSGGSTTAIKLTEDEAALVPTDVSFLTPFTSINESQDSFTVIVQRKYSTEDTAKVTVSLVGGTATDGLDFNFPGNITLTFAPGALKSDSFKMNIIDDLLTEGDEVLTLKLINPINANIGSPTLSLTIVDNDVPTIKFVDKVIVTREGLGNAVARIAIENGTATATTLNAQVQSKSALTNIPAEFYLSINDPNDTLISFNNGLANDTFKMTGFIVDDAAIDAPDTIFVVLRNPSGTAKIGADSVLMIIVKDDDAPPGVRFIGSSSIVDENIGNAKVQIEILNRNNNPSDFSLKYIGSKSSTTEGSDLTFNPTSQIFTFGLTGSDTMTINIPIIDDTNFEMDEVAVFAVEGTVNNTTLKPDTFRITIRSDDVEKITIAAASNINVGTGAVTRSGDKVIVTGIVHGYNRQSTLGLEFTIIDATGGIQISSPFKTFNYTVKEGDSVSVQGLITQFRGVAQISALDTIISLKMGLNTFTPKPVTKFDESTEQEIVVVNTVRFIDVVAWPSSALSANGEAFAKAINGSNDTLNIRIDAEGPLNGTAAPSKALYYNITGIGSQSDNTSPFLSGYYLDPSKLSDFAVVNSPKVSFNITTLTVSETADSTPQIQVNIANSGFQNVSFKIDSNNGTALVPKDFTFTPITLSLLSTVSNYKFQVNLSDEDEKDGNKTIILVLKNPGYGVLIGADSILTITISDNETGIKTLNPNLVKIYPNPTNGLINLVSKKTISSIKIYNINGVEVANESENNHIVSLENQPAGLYQLVLEVEGEFYSTRIQKH